jgi:hypothetical protein
MLRSLVNHHRDSSWRNSRLRKLEETYLKESTSDRNFNHGWSLVQATGSPWDWYTWGVGAVVCNQDHATMKTCTCSTKLFGKKYSRFGFYSGINFWETCDCWPQEVQLIRFDFWRAKQWCCLIFGEEDEQLQGLGNYFLFSHLPIPIFCFWWLGAAYWRGRLCINTNKRSL